MASTARSTKAAARAKRGATARATKATKSARATKSAAKKKVGTAEVAAGAAPVIPPRVIPRNLTVTAPTIAERSGTPRRAIFIDVENTSSETELVRVLDELNIDRRAQPTEITAVGNWRVIGQQMGRMLAARGAHLVHSAPATRVRDWSDLWIAVSAGMWLGRASSGDSIDIISDDRAFDAVGDAAARLGIAYRRISCRGHHAVAVTESPHPADSRGARTSAGGRRRRRRGGSGRGAAAPEAARPISPKHDEAGDEERHAASQAQIRAIVARLTGADPARGVSLDALTVALKAEGFQRPPGSPRLITRLRRLKDLEVLPNARVRLVGDSADIASAVLAASDQPASGVHDGDTATTEAESERASADDTDADANGDATPTAVGEPMESSRRRRSRRRGGRRRTRRSSAPAHS